MRRRFSLEAVLAKGFVGACAALVLGFFILLGVGLYQDAMSPTFELRKDSWGCTAHHEEVSTTFIQQGNILTPITSSSTVCDQWSRR